MGVGAVFVSTLAISRLPEPHSPPENQQEYLAATLQTIVAFIVLGSILIRTSRSLLFIVHHPSFVCFECTPYTNTPCPADGLSIPFFSFGRRIHSQTVSLTRTLTSRNNTMGNTLPEWLMGTRRMPPTSEIDVYRGVVGQDVEAARTGDHKPEPHVHMAQDADVLVVSQGVEEGQEGRVPHFGEASFLEEPPRTRESSLRRRNMGVEVPVGGSAGGVVVNEVRCFST